MSDTSNETTNDGIDSGGDDILTQLVGEGRKFKSVGDLAKGKVEADSFINKLQDENKALRSLISNQEDRTRSTQLMQELLDRVSKSTLDRDNGAATIPPTTAQPNNQNGTALSAGDVEQIYVQLRKREYEEANLTKALSKVADKYGDKTEEHLRNKAKEIGLDLDMLKDTARRSPQAFLNLIGENANANPVPRGPRSSVNSATVIETGTSNLRDKKYYDKIKTEMGTKKFIMDSKIQVQMHKDMMDLGDRWDSE